MADEPSVSAPPSGAYGETAAQDRLKAALPLGSIGASGGRPAEAPMKPEPIAPRPAGAEGRPPTGAAVPPGIPGVLLGATEQPHVPVNTPLATPLPPSPGVVDQRQARVALLDQLANSPDVSEETRDWASTVLRMVIGG